MEEFGLWYQPLKSIRKMLSPADLFNFGKVNEMFQFHAREQGVSELIVIDPLTEPILRLWWLAEKLIDSVNAISLQTFTDVINEYQLETNLKRVLLNVDANLPVQETLNRMRLLEHLELQLTTQRQDHQPIDLVLPNLKVFLVDAHLNTVNLFGLPTAVCVLAGNVAFNPAIVTTLQAVCGPPDFMRQFVNLTDFHCLAELRANLIQDLPHLKKIYVEIEQEEVQAEIRADEEEAIGGNEHSDDEEEEIGEDHEQLDAMQQLLQEKLEGVHQVELYLNHVLVERAEQLNVN